MSMGHSLPGDDYPLQARVGPAPRRPADARERLRVAGRQSIMGEGREREAPTSRASRRKTPCLSILRQQQRYGNSGVAKHTRMSTFGSTFYATAAGGRLTASGPVHESQHRDG